MFQYYEENSCHHFTSFYDFCFGCHCLLLHNSGFMVLLFLNGMWLKKNNIVLLLKILVLLCINYKFFPFLLHCLLLPLLLFLQELHFFSWWLVSMFFLIYFLIYGYDKQLVNSITHLHFQSTFWNHEKVHAAEMVFNQALLFTFEFTRKWKGAMISNLFLRFFFLFFFF